MNTWEETVRELGPEVRLLFLHEQKLEIGVKMGTKAKTLEYERLRFTLIGVVVALEGYCDVCKQHVVLQMKIRDLYRRLAHAHTALNGLGMKCTICNTPDRTLRLPNLWE